jgi:hypothetical protein
MPGFNRLTNKVKPGLTATVLLFGIIAFYLPMLVRATGLTPRTMQQLNSGPGATTDYTLNFTINNGITLGSLSILICGNTPLEGDLCSLPPGLDVTNAQLTAQSGITDFTLFNVGPDSMLLSHPAATVSAPQAVSFTFHNIVNPSVPGPYYVRVAAYSSTNGTGPSVAFGGLAFAVNHNVQVSSVVPPYLTFCSGITIPSFACPSASGDQIDFGNLSPVHSSQAASQLLVATNASNGYVIQVAGTTMTAGNNIITALTTGTASQPGSPQFGINLRANSAPAIGSDPDGPGSGQPANDYAQANRFRFDSNDVIAASAAPDNYRRYTVSYLVNVPADQSPGVYASTLTYVAVGSF